MMSDEMAASLHAQIAELRAQLANRDAEIADDHLENQYLFQIAELRGRVAKHKATIAERDATVLSLRAQLAERSREIAELRAAIVRLCGNAKTTLDLNEWLEIYAPEQWFAGYDVAESALMALKDYSESIVYLRAQVATLTERLSRCTCTDDDGNEAP